jgi:hypothetical protein
LAGPLKHPALFFRIRQNSAAPAPAWIPSAAAFFACLKPAKVNSFIFSQIILSLPFYRLFFKPGTLFSYTKSDSGAPDAAERPRKARAALLSITTGPFKAALRG